MSNVINLRLDTTVDIPCEKVLTAAIESDLESVIVIGRTKDGELYTSCSRADIAPAILDIELTKRRMLDWAHQ